MVNSCVAYNCSSRFDRESGVSFFRFPRNEQKSRKWCIALRRKYFEPKIHSRICSEHFAEDAFVPGFKRKLKCNAVPTIFNFEDSKSYRRKKRKLRKIKKKYKSAKVKRFNSNTDASGNIADEGKIDNVRGTSEPKCDQIQKEEIVMISNSCKIKDGRNGNYPDKETPNKSNEDKMDILETIPGLTGLNDDNFIEELGKTCKFEDAISVQINKTQNKKLRHSVFHLNKRIEKFWFLIDYLEATNMISEEAAIVLRTSIEL